MKKVFLLAILAGTQLVFGQNDSIVLRRLSDEILLQGKCYDDLRVLCKTIGHRLSGSVQADQAVVWAKNTLKDAGADTVWLQPVEVPVWTRGEEFFKLQTPRGEWLPIPALSLGNMEGTEGSVLEKEVIAVPDFKTFASLDASEVEDKIVFFNYAFRQDLVNTFEGYGDAVAYRWNAVNEAAAKGAAAVVIRSIGTNQDDVAHTGSSHYVAQGRKIPAMALGNASADQLFLACKAGKVKAQLMSQCKNQGTKISYNVIGELRGTDFPNEYLVVAGHLDSWDVGEGAHDDGAGCVQSIEVLRTFKSLNILPKHTLRVVLYMNEENGMKGGLAYADSALSKQEKHLFALESDAGGFVPRGISL